MANSEPQIPEWINEQIEFNPSREVQDEHIISVFLEDDRPFLSRRKVEIDVGLSDEQTRKRLRQLEDLGILGSTGFDFGRVYWVRDQHSEWPIPDDVTVHPVDNELTVAEALSRNSVKFGALGVGAMILGSFLMVAFTVVLAYEVPLPVLLPEHLLLASALVDLLGLSLVIVALTSWIGESFAS